MQPFLGKNFIRKLNTIFSHIMKPLQDMIKKDAIFEWDQKVIEAFANIKEGIATTLCSPNFGK